MNELKYEFVAGYGELGRKNVRGADCSVQLCREKWNGHETWAIRCFYPDGKYTKGITLTTEHMCRLKELLAELDLEEQA